MIKKIFTLIMLLSIFYMAGNAQVKPTKVSKAVYFDKIGPIKDLTPGYIPRKNEKEKNLGLKVRVYPYAATALPKGEDAVRQNKQGEKKLGRTPLLNFAGQSSPYYPSDCNGDVGKNYYMQTVNTTFAIYDKTGTQVVSATDMNTLFAGVTGASNNDGDPIILYDDQADRWMAAEFSVSGSPDYMLIAISETSDPTGNWYRWSFVMNGMPDYEKFGIWRDGYYMATNTTSGDDIYVFERDVMLAGGASPQMVQFDNPNRPASGFHCIMPLDNDGVFAPVNSPGLYITINDDAWGGTDQLWIYECNVDWATPANSIFARTQQLNVSPFDANFGTSWDNIAQPGTSQKLDGIPQILMYKAQYRNFGTSQNIVCAHAVDVDNSDHAGVRWYELQKTGATWSIRQQGTYAPDAHSRWLPGIAMNSKREIALGYNISSSTLYPGIRYCGQSSVENSLASGIMDIAEEVIQTGAASQTSGNRWGDYPLLSVDPSDDVTFWFTTEYFQSGKKTRIAKFRFSEPEDPQNLLALAVSTTQIDISWSLNDNSEPALVAWSPNGVFGTPVDGVTYSAGQSIPGGGTVISYGTTPLSYSHTGLTPATSYFYKAWSYKTDNTYSSGMSASASTLTGDPLTLVAEAMSKYEIDLSWTLNAENNNVVLAWSADGNFGTLTNGNTYTVGEAVSGGGQILYIGNNTSFNHFSLNPGTKYFYKAWSIMSGNVYSPGISAEATTNPDAIFYDDFETETGWTINGEWQIDAPQGLGGDHGNPDPASAVSGTKILGLDLTGLGTYPGDYEANLSDHQQTAVSPTIDCSNYSNVNVSFQKYIGIESPTYDHAYFEISVNGGSSWTVLWTNDASIADNIWTEQSYDVSSYADGEPDVRFRYAIGSSDGSWQYCGWNIDDFMVSGTSNIPTYTAEFTVTDINTSAPVSGAAINVNGSTYNTNISGVANITLPDGNFAYTVSATGYSNSIGNVSISGAGIAEAVELTPLPVYTVTFTVTDAVSTNPIENATINIYGENIITNASGVATIDLFSGTFPYTVTAAGYNSYAANVTVAGATQTVDLTLDLTTYSVTFNVTESNGTTAIQDATVDFEGTQLNTNASGTAVFNDYLPSTYNWSVNKTGYIEQTGSTTIIDANKTVNTSLTAESNSIIDMKNNGISIYPNPAKGIFHVNFDKAQVNTIITINDVTGKEVMTKVAENTTSIKIDLTNNAKGIYFINFMYEGETINSKIIIE